MTHVSISDGLFYFPIDNTGIITNSQENFYQILKNATYGFTFMTLETDKFIEFIYDISVIYDTIKILIDGITAYKIYGFNYPECYSEECSEDECYDLMLELNDVKIIKFIDNTFSTDFIVLTKTEDNYMYLPFNIDGMEIDTQYHIDSMNDEFVILYERGYKKTKKVIIATIEDDIIMLDLGKSKLIKFTIVKSYD